MSGIVGAYYEVGRLERDLRVYPVVCPGLEIDSIPHVPGLPKCASDTAAWGWRYCPYFRDFRSPASTNRRMTEADVVDAALATPPATSVHIVCDLQRRNAAPGV